MPLAVSYLRFSTPQQMQGDSFRRQTALAVEYAARKGLTLDDKLTFHDLGVSAYRGTNSETGRLGDFLEAVRAGLVPRGSFLLVESLDRISRQAARKALRVLESICEEDITVVTLSDNREYTRDLLDNDPMALIMSILVFVRSNEESAMKSRRLRSVWLNKQTKAPEKALTANGPKWLRLRPDKTWEVLPERAEVVLRVFGWASEGRGIMWIARELNLQGVPVWTRGTQWHHSYVNRMLRNPAAAGIYVPHTTEFVGKSRTRKPRLTPVPGYYPAVVGEELFQRVQALKLGTSNAFRGTGGTAGEMQNLFSGLLECARCRGSVVMVHKGGYNKRRIVCAKAKAGAGCAYAAVIYSDVEHAFLAAAPRLVQEAPEVGTDIHATELHRVLQTSLDAATEHMLKVRDAFVDTRSPSLAEALREAEIDVGERRVALQESQARLDAARSPVVQRRLEEAGRALEVTPVDRRALNAHLRLVFERVVVDVDGRVLRCLWRHGGEHEVRFGWPEGG